MFIPIRLADDPAWRFTHRRHEGREAGNLISNNPEIEILSDNTN